MTAATAGLVATADSARDEAVLSATAAVTARNEAVSHASNLHLVAEALAAGDYVEDYGLITEPADEIVDYGSIMDPAN